MKWATLPALLALLMPAGTVLAAAAKGFRLPAHRDAFFVENDLVYRRFLALMHDGAYRQINQDRTACAEVDQGTWDQTPDGVVRLHSTRHALRFRALTAGPLTVVLDSQEKLNALPRLAASIRRFLDSTQDGVFRTVAADELGADPASVAVGQGAETFSRDDVQSLLRQAEDTAASERTGVYPFMAVKPPGSTALLVLQDAVFQAADQARVRRDYPVKGNDAPPFFFAQVDARTFAREVGSWQAFHFLGEPD